MVKFHNRASWVIVILLMLASSPLTVTYSFADSNEDTKQEFGKNSESSKQAILTEKIVDGKLKVKWFSLPDNTTEGDLDRMFSFEESSEWAYVNSKSYNPGIILYDGKASKVGENLWKISVDRTMNTDGTELDLEFNGKSNGFDAEIHGTASEKDLSYRVIFSGKTIESFEESVFGIAFMNSVLKNHETVQNIKFLYGGELNINSEKSITISQKYIK